MRFDFHKVVQILAYLAKKEWWTINYMKALKLIFFMDKYFVRQHGRTISFDTYKAMKLWPVASNTLNIITNPIFFDEEYIGQYLKQTGYDIRAMQAPDMDYFSEKEVEAMDMVYTVFWWADEWGLSDSTHKYIEWKKYENDVYAGGSRNMHIADFFENSFDQDAIFDTSDEDIALSRALFEERRAYV